MKKSLSRPDYRQAVKTALRRSQVTAILGPRQSGKTTLARVIAEEYKAVYFDLSSVGDQRRLENPEYVLGRSKGLVVIDEIQLRPELFSVLRVLADRPDGSTRFLILGSAAPELMKGASESLAGRVEFIHLQGFDLREVGKKNWERLWYRGGFPRSFLAETEEDSFSWRESLVQTYLQRDIPELGIRIPSAALRRFWTLLAHSHGGLWNASQIGCAMGLSDKTVRGYLDILTETFMIRQLQPWHENIAKRQVKSPKVYFRDTGLLHTLLDVRDDHGLLGHPACGHSWEGYVIEQVIRLSQISNGYFWGTQGGAELDLFFMHNGKRYGVEVKMSDAPSVTRSMHSALETLQLDRLWIIAQVKTRTELNPRVEVCPLHLWDEAWDDQRSAQEIVKDIRNY
jgi:predicted AAA+ superfamily ATPase